MVYFSHSASETELIGAELARSLVGGDCVALVGPLGAGKTQFVRGMAMGLGANGRAVSSPTFVLLNIYRGGRLMLFHLDAYRTGGADDFEGIGFSELLEQSGVVAVEWAERIGELLPGRRIHVEIDVLGESERRISIERMGAGGDQD
jgi:tRNA threonylcarbamoyladenosine biosynthesis protein TsaE